MPDSEAAKALQRSIRHQAYAIGLLALVVTVAVVVFYIELGNETSRTTAALCTFRNDLSQRVDSSEEFLRTHPTGIPGVPASAIRRSLAAQRSTIAALAALDCPAQPKKEAP